MFDLLFEKIRRIDEIERKLLSIFEGKSWEYIATALYQTFNDISECGENTKAFRKAVLVLQVEKNHCSRVSECGHTYEKEYDVHKLLWPKGTQKRITCSNCGAIFSVRKNKSSKIVKCPDCGEKIEEGLNENLSGHARRELELAGMFDTDVDGSEAMGSWNNLCAEAVLELMEVFAGQGHSGFSASMTQELFSRLAKYEKLTELTDNSDEWSDISEYQSGEAGWQNRRSPSCFSKDGGKSYWDINEDWFYHEDENGDRWGGGLSEEEWSGRPIHQSKHIEKKE